MRSDAAAIPSQEPSYLSGIGEKHLVYRVLAETMRTKFFLRAAGADRLVSISELINLTGIDQFAGFSWIGNLLKNLEPTARVRRLIAVRAIRHRKRVDVNCKCGDC